jgi:uncharacterized protein YerC
MAAENARLNRICKRIAGHRYVVGQTGCTNVRTMSATGLNYTEIKKGTGWSVKTISRHVRGECRHG